MLNNIYATYSRWSERFPFACRKGCATCCTQSVTMTSLEGELILDFVKRKNMEKWLTGKLAKSTPGNNRITMTTNQFAGACLEHREVDGEAQGSWNFTPCIFLEAEICSIYEVRPFGCRSFGSLVRCTADQAAEIAPIHLAVNTVFTQIIEHLSSDGGYWSTMADILTSLTAKRGRAAEMHLLPAQPVPGFLLEPREVQVVQVLLQQVRGQFSDKDALGDLIDNFMPI